MKFLNRINLKINEYFYDRIKVKQNDTARYLLFNLLDDGVPFSLENKTVRVYGLKPDGTKVFNNLTIINAARGLVELQLTTQMLVKPGCLKLELVIYEATDILSTTKFDIDIISCIRDDSAIESTNEFSALTLGLSKLDEWDKYFKETSGAIEEKYTERLNEIDSSLKNIETEVNDKIDGIINPSIDTIVNLPQSPMPMKIGLQENNYKLVIKNSNAHYSVIQKINKDYIMYDLKSGIGGSGNSDTSGNCDLLRLVRVKPVPACYVYNDDYVVSGTQTDYLLEGNYNVLEQALFQFYAPVVINEYKSSKASNGGLKCIGVKSADGTGKFTFSFKMTKVNKGNILIMCSANSSVNNEIQVNGKTVKTFDATCTTGNEYKLIEFDLPIKYGNDAITVDVVNKDTASKNLYLICANFRELKDYKGEYITKYKAFVDSSAYIDSTGANEYAIYNNETQKFCGSYHGGETLLEGKLTWVNSDRFDIEARKIETTISNSYANGSFCLIKDFYIRQRTNIVDKGQMISQFDFTVDGTVGMKMSWLGDITTDNFYTSLTCTHKDFTKINYPQYLELKDTENQDYFLFGTDGFVSQENPTAMLKMDIRFNKWNKAYTNKDLWIKSLSTSYRKCYYGFIEKTNRVKKVSFMKCLDFYRV